MGKLGNELKTWPDTRTPFPECWRYTRARAVLTAEIGYACSTIWVCLFLPYSSCYTKLKLFLVSSWEKKCHVTLNNKAIMAVSNFYVTIPDAPGGAFPYKFPTISTNFQAVTIVSSLYLISHESEESHVNRSCAQLKCFEMKTKILTKTIENLKRKESHSADTKLFWE